jgi:hypothetical protein
MPSEFRDVDPRKLRLPWSRISGPDPIKYARQVSRFGSSSVGMPPIVVYEGNDGELMIYNGVTRATCLARLSPNSHVRVEVIGRLRRAFGPQRSIGDLMP